MLRITKAKTLTARVYGSQGRQVCMKSCQKCSAGFKPLPQRRRIRSRRRGSSSLQAVPASLQGLCFGIGWLSRLTNAPDNKSKDPDCSGLWQSRSSGLYEVLPEMQRRIQAATTAAQNPVAQWRQQLAADTVSAAAIGCRLSLPARKGFVLGLGG